MIEYIGRKNKSVSASLYSFPSCNILYTQYTLNGISAVHIIKNSRNLRKLSIFVMHLFNFSCSIFFYFKTLTNFLLQNVPIGTLTRRRWNSLEDCGQLMDLQYLQFNLIQSIKVFISPFPNRTNFATGLKKNLGGT